MFSKDEFVMRIPKRAKGKKREAPLNIKGSLSDVLKVAVKDNPKPKKKAK
jgi:hypothetical protein